MAACIDTYLKNFQLQLTDKNCLKEGDRSGMSELNKYFKQLRKPDEQDLVDYNWIVDGILKNSTSY